MWAGEKRAEGRDGGQGRHNLVVLAGRDADDGDGGDPVQGGGVPFRAAESRSGRRIEEGQRVALEVSGEGDAPPVDASEREGDW